MTYPDDLWTSIVWRSVGEKSSKSKLIEHEERKKIWVLKDFSICTAKLGLYNQDTTNIKKAYTTVYKCEKHNLGRQ